MESHKKTVAAIAATVRKFYERKEPFRIFRKSVLSLKVHADLMSCQPCVLYIRFSWTNDFVNEKIPGSSQPSSDFTHSLADTG